MLEKTRIEFLYFDKFPCILSTLFQFIISLCMRAFCNLHIAVTPLKLTENAFEGRLLEY